MVDEAAGRVASIAAQFVPAPQAFAVSNATWMALCLFTAPLAGSATSGFIWATMVIGVAAMLAWRSAAIPLPVRICAVIFASFFAAEALSGIIHSGGALPIGEIAENMVFLGLVPLYLLLRLDKQTFADKLVAAAPGWAFCALAFALMQKYSMNLSRPWGGAGNPAVFALVVTVLYAYCVAGLFSAGQPRKWLAVAGSAAAAAAIVYSGTRGVWPAILLFPLLGLAIHFRPGNGRRMLAAVVGLLVLLSCFAILNAPAISERIAEVRAELNAPKEDWHKQSIGRRMIMWQVAVEAIVEKPLTGHGLTSPRTLMQQRIAPFGDGSRLQFSHFHNFVLNEWVRAGLPGLLSMLAMLVAPVFVALRAWRSNTGNGSGQTGLYLISATVIAYVLGGAGNLMFDHDIQDAVYVAAISAGLYMVFGPQEIQPSGPKTSA